MALLTATAKITSAFPTRLTKMSIENKTVKAIYILDVHLKEGE